MREQRIKLFPFDELRVEDYRGIKQVNEHAYAEITGMIPFKRKEEYIDLCNRETWVQVVASGEEQEYILFCGLVEKIKIEVMNKTCMMRVTLKSGTILLDEKKRIRSFQSPNLYYEDLLSVCNKNYSNAKEFMTEGQGKATGQFVMQYQETDWTFIKRLASMNNTIVVADSTICGEKYYFGIPEGKSTIDCEHIEYRIEGDVDEYWRKKGKGLDIAPTDTMTYIWESREIYELGDEGVIGGRQLAVWKIETKMKGSLLYHTYYMRSKAGFQVPLQYNMELCGVSLFGKTVGVKKEKVQIELTEDENKGQAQKYWFPYATVYSSPDGTGWYCMPEIEDKIRIYFPTEQENDAYVASAYHEGDGGLRTNPACKFWRNKGGKEIQLSPDKILLTNNNGTYVEFSDAEGIKMVSEGTVAIEANGGVYLSSRNASIELDAKEKVAIRQGDTSIDLAGNLHLSGAQIKL